MNILYLGNFRAPYCTEHAVVEALEDLGNTVFKLLEDRSDSGKIAMAVIDHKIDLVFYSRTWGVVGDLLGVFKWLKERGVITVSYHPDLYNGLERSKIFTPDKSTDIKPIKFEDDPFWNTEFVFSSDGGSEEFFKEKGINHHWIKSGIRKSSAYVAEYDPKWDYDVVFVGGYEYLREWPYRRVLIDFLRETYGNRFRRFGPPARDSLVRMDDLNKLYASSKVIVGDTLCLGYNHKNYWSDRLYETLGRGGFLIHPWVDGMDQEFPDATCLIAYNYGDFEQLKDRIDYYLDKPKLRRHIAMNGHNYVKNNCTFHHRVSEIMKIIKETTCKASQ